MSNQLIITLRDGYRFVRFTWSIDLSEVSFVTGGDVTDKELDAILAVDGHEGADVAGWTTTIE